MIGLFPQLQMKLKRRRFEVVADIQGEWQAALDSIEESYFARRFGSMEGDGGMARGWCVQKETVPILSEVSIGLHSPATWPYRSLEP
jgi:hypothetical protein